MAQTNFTPILTYKSDTATVVPSAGNLTNSANGAELAVNTADKRLFTKDSGGNVVELGTNPSSLTLPNSTANGVVYANGSKVLTTGSALTFDGTNLGVGLSSTNAKLNILQNLSGAATSTGIWLTDNATTSLYANNISSGLSGIWASGALAFGSNNGTFTEGMRLTSTGLGIGTSSPTYKLEIYDATNPRFSLNTGASGTSEIRFSTPSSGYQGLITYSAASNFMAFYTSATERMRLDASGNLGLGVTPSAWSGIKAFEFGTGTSNGSLYSFGNDTTLSTNMYYNGGFKYDFIFWSWLISLIASTLAGMIPARKSLALNPIDVIREG